MNESPAISTGMPKMQKEIIMAVVMMLCIAILGYFVYIETGNQAKIIELLKTCDYTEICKTCYSPLRDIKIGG